MVRRCWFVLCLSFIGCLRDLPDLPSESVGAEVTGQVLRWTGDLQAGTPVVGAVLELRGHALLGLTDERGYFRVPAAPPGTYDLVVREGAHVVRVVPGLELRDRASRDLGLIEVGDPGRLRGTVGVRRGAEIHSPAGTYVGIGHTSLRGFSNLAGVWSVPSVPAGQHGLVFARAGFRTVHRSRVEVHPGIDTEVDPIFLEPLADGDGRLQGSVVDERGAGLAGVRVSARTELEEAGSWTTTEAGTFEGHLPSGLYTLRFEAEGRVPVEQRGIWVGPDGSFGLARAVLVARNAMDGDRDRLPDAQDPDRDNDGLANEVDFAPDDPTRGLDRNQDGEVDVFEPDQDHDGLSDAEEGSLGFDGWFTHALRADSDGDGIEDAVDVCPTAPDPDQLDRDGDGRGDACIRGPLGPLLGVQPARAPVGARVEVRAPGLSDEVEAAEQVSVQFGIDGPRVSALSLTEDGVQVRVPTGAGSRELRVVTPAGRRVGTALFCVADSPAVHSIRVEQPRAGGKVWVSGSGLAADHCPASLRPRLRLLVTTATGTAEVRTLMPPTRYLPVVANDATFVLPDAVASGPIFVRVDDYQSEAVELRLPESSLVVDELSPTPSPPGGLITLRGAGFQSAGPLYLSFPGIAREVLVDPLSDHEFTVAVPFGSTDGDLQLRSSAQTMSVPLDVDTPPAPTTGMTLDIGRQGVVTYTVDGVARPEYTCGTGNEEQTCVAEVPEGAELVFTGAAVQHLDLDGSPGDLVFEPSWIGDCRADPSEPWNASLRATGSGDCAFELIEVAPAAPCGDPDEIVMASEYSSGLWFPLAIDPPSTQTLGRAKSDVFGLQGPTYGPRYIVWESWSSELGMRRVGQGTLLEYPDVECPSGDLCELRLRVGDRCHELVRVLRISNSEGF